MVPFPFPANAAELLHEDVAYLTDVLEAYDSTEQRIQLRAIPRRALEYSMLCKDPRQAGHANALLYGFREQGFGVPLWMYGERMTAPASFGATVLPVSVTDIPWALGDSVFLWTDPFTWEIQDFVSTAGGQVNCTALDAAWPTGTLVVPMRLGRLGTSAAFSWPDRDAGTARLQFVLEGPGLTAPAGNPVGAIYRGFEILDGKIPNRRDPVEENVEKKMAILDQLTGPVQQDPHALLPTPTRSLLWTAGSRAQAKLMADFLDARRGRAIPFWVPSYQGDLALSVDLAGGGVTATIRWAGYKEYIWDKGIGRRHVAIYRPGFPLEYKRITAAAHTPGAATETITFDAGTVRDYFASSTTIMFLKYCRLDSDSVRRTWHSNQVVEAELPLRELPLEEPV